MTYKTILMRCNEKRRMKAMLAPTLTLASMFESHVVGLSVAPPVSVIPAGALEAPPIIVDAQRELYRKEVPLMREQFDNAVIGRPITSEWRDMEAGIATLDVVLEQSRAADLVVAHQTDEDSPWSELLDVADILVMESGRPVLIIPNGRASDRIGTRVLVAWNGRREAARAAFDALPLLQQASAVRIVRVREGSAEVEQPGADICQSLVRHGVKADRTEDIEAAGTSAGAALLADADAFDADLVVMGCYGHSRLREFVFGGATRYFLQKMRVPVLMSH